MSHHTNLDEKLERADNFRAWKYRISLVLEENELDSYISGEVRVPEEDQAKALHKNKVFWLGRTPGKSNPNLPLNQKTSTIADQLQI